LIANDIDIYGLLNSSIKLIFNTLTEKVDKLIILNSNHLMYDDLKILITHYKYSRLFFTDKECNIMMSKEIKKLFKLY